MFFPQRMKKIDVMILKQDVDNVSKEIVKFGEFQVLEIDPEKAKKQLLTKSVVENQVARLSEYDRRTNFLLTSLEGFKFSTQIESRERVVIGEFYSESEMEQLLREVEADVNNYNQQLEAIYRRKADIEISIKKLNLFGSYGLDLHKLKDMQFVYAGFGIIPITSYEGFTAAMASLPEVNVTYKVDTMGKDVLVFYVASNQAKDKIDAILKNVYFRDYGLPTEIDKDSVNKMIRYAFGLSTVVDEELWLERNFQKTMQKKIPILLTIKETIQYYLAMSKLKAEMAGTGKVYLFSGWIPTNALEKVRARIVSLTDDKCVFLDKTATQAIEEEGLFPPTKFSNPKIFKPFEFLVATYGIPNYREIDPTPFMAIGYVFMYGAMFGDIGHGIVLALIGIMAMMNKKMKVLQNFGAILVYIGISAMFFGFLYGEIFGKAGVVNPLWMSPAHHIMDILSISIVFGTGIISMSLILSIINSILEKNYGRLFFATTGLPGLTFYWSVLAMVFMTLNKIAYPSYVMAIPIAALVIIALEKHLERLFHKKGKHGHAEAEEKPNLMIGLVEVFEAVIAFVSKTVSFVRVGAFALNHGALMGVVFIIADGMKSPISKWIALLIGNLFVIGVEGFIVGIQALRLQYYEFFVAFFRANGKPFEGLGIYKTNS